MAIDPRRLQSELDHIAQLAGDPQRLQRATLRLLEGYQVRRRKDGRPRNLVPAPVMRALARRLQAQLRSDPSGIADTAGALWGSGRSEARYLAAQLLGELEGERAAELVERWIHASIPLELVKELAEAGLRRLRRESPDRFLERCADWLHDKHRLLGLYSLRAAARDPQFENLPRVFELVEGLGGRLRGRPRSAMLELMRALAGRAPAEAVQFLRDELQHSGEPAKRLVGDMLPSLSPEQREALRGPNGIIRAQAGRPKGR